MDRRPPSPGRMKAQCDAFNADHPPGTEIRVFPGGLNDASRIALVAVPGAYVLGGHTAVVQIMGGGGCIALSHVREP